MCLDPIYKSGDSDLIINVIYLQGLQVELGDELSKGFILLLLQFK